MSGRGQSLGGGDSNEPLPAEWGRPSAPRIGRIGGTSSSTNTSSSSRGGIGRIPVGAQDDEDDDDDGDDEKKAGENWFAGGERSGLAVQNPNNSTSLPGGRLVRDILRQATEQGIAPGPESRTVPRPFGGGGHILGGDEVESSYVPDPNAIHDEEDEPVVRHLHLWSEGFSIEDGPLMRYDEPGNQELLRSIQQGTAPLSLMNVRQGQRVDLNVVTRLRETYVPPKRSNFSGSGQRLGAPTPCVDTAAAEHSGSMPGSFPTGNSSTSASSGVERRNITTHFEVDQTRPTTSVQIRLADGTRMPCRMNLSHTVGDIRAFINASRPENATQRYTIGTTFPNRILEDDGETIESAGLVNSVVVQRWV